jgi:hypothetical protein
MHIDTFMYPFITFIYMYIYKYEYLALPFDPRPVNLDGSMPGDVGFDPAGFSNKPPKAWLIGGEENSLKWYQIFIYVLIYLCIYVSTHFIYIYE